MSKFNPRGRRAVLVLSMTAAFAASAQDKSNITIYGNIDMAIVKQTGGALTMDRGYNNWLGFRGEEKIDDNLSAIFNLQTRFRPDTGAQETGIFWQGESTVGLKSATGGTLRFGRALSPFWQQKWMFEPWYDSQLNGSLGAYQNGSYATDPSAAFGYANWARMDNTVFYDSPSLGNFQVHLGGQVERPAAAPSRTVGLSVNYQRDTVSGLFSYERNYREDDIYFLAGSVGFGPAALMGSYSVNKLAGLSRERNALVAATYAVNGNTVRGGYGKNFENGNHKYSIGINRPLSKRTNLYADLYRETTTTNSVGTAVGMNHTF